MHGAEIIGYKHPHPLLKKRWQHFYLHAVDDMHLSPETEVEMDERLNDWNQEFWPKENDS